MDYTARNHEQRIHRRIVDSGSNNVIRVFRSSNELIKISGEILILIAITICKSPYLFVVNFIFSTILKLSFVELSKLACDIFSY